IAELLGKRNTFFAAPNLRCVFRNGETIGIMAGYELSDLRRVERAVGAAFYRVFGIAGFLSRIPTWLKMNRILDGDMASTGYYVVYVCVSEPWRGQGIGKDIFEELLHDHADVYLHVNAENAAAIRFYERIGFVKAFTGQGQIRGHHLAAHLMHRHR
ncbi:MAG: GNAT family N-acetyltransferase, partial [bacterium]